MDARELRSRADPAGLPPLLVAPWWDACGDREKAHGLAQSVKTPEGAWVQAYLHRREGDLGNADYWCRRAGRRRPAASLEAEWGEIVGALAGQ